MTTAERIARAARLVSEAREVVKELELPNDKQRAVLADVQRALGVAELGLDGIGITLDDFAEDAA